MTSNTPTSHMMAAANKFMELYMVEATNRFGIESSDPLDVLKKLWDEMQPKLQAEIDSISEISPKKRKRKRSSGRKKKRGKSAYIFFCKDERITIKSEHPDLAPKEVMVELGRRWSEAKKGDISKWEEQAAQDKARVESATESAEPKKKKKKKKKSSSKKGKSAYNFFCKAERVTIKTENEGLAPREIMTELGKRWREAKKGDISKWKEQAAKDKARYKKESEAEADVHPVESDEDVPPVEKKSVKKRVYTYSFWAKMHRSEITRSTGLKGKELTKELSTQWKALSKEEKAKWKAATLEAAEAVAE